MREITKLHEEVISLTLSEMISHFKEHRARKIGSRHCAAKSAEYSDDDIADLLRERMTDLSVKDAVAEVASLTADREKPSIKWLLP